MAGARAQPGRTRLSRGLACHDHPLGRAPRPAGPRLSRALACHDGRARLRAPVIETRLSRGLASHDVGAERAVRRRGPAFARAGGPRTSLGPAPSGGVASWCGTGVSCREGRPPFDAGISRWGGAPSESGERCDPGEARPAEVRAWNHGVPAPVATADEAPPLLRGPNLAGGGSQKKYLAGVVDSGYLTRSAFSRSLFEVIRHEDSSPRHARRASVALGCSALRTTGAPAVDRGRFVGVDHRFGDPERDGLRSRYHGGGSRGDTGGTPC